MEDKSIRERLALATSAAEQGAQCTRLATLRLINCAIQDRDIAIRAEHCAGDGASASEDSIRQLLEKMIAQREKSAADYEEAGRLELAERERAEIEVVREFLPPKLSPEEAEAAVAAVIHETGAGDLRDLGRVMHRLKELYAGRMDFSRAGGWVKDALS